MTIMDSLLRLFESTEPDHYSNDEVKVLIRQNLERHVEEYRKYYRGQARKFSKRASVFRLLALRIFGAEVWELVRREDRTDKDAFWFRRNAIAKTYFRALLNTDENICLAEKGYGVSMVSNVRMILECLAIANYLWEKGEPEAERFQDYTQVQAKQMSGESATGLFGNKYETNFYRTDGWITDKKFRSISSLVRRMRNAEYTRLHRFASQYVHASPFSLESVLAMNHATPFTSGSYFPLGETQTILLNEVLVVDFIKTMIDFFVPDELAGVYRTVVLAIQSNA